MRALIFAVLTLFLISVEVFSEEVSLTAELKKSAQTLRLANGKLEGPGAEFLLRQARNSRFVLVGEDHGIADIPEFCKAFFLELQAAGFNTLAVETGPITASLLQKMSRSQNPMGELGNFDRRYFFSIPFYNWREEAEFIFAFGKQGRILGLDQEFVLSPSFHFQRLIELAPDDAARKVAEGMLKRAEDGQKQMLEQKNPGTVFMVTANESDFQALESAFHPNKNDEAEKIINELRVSWKIYALNFQGKFMESNSERALLMKQHFHESNNQLGEPKILVKLGAYHAMRGRSLVGVHDIGNHLSEMAEGESKRSFHVLVLPVKGTVNAYRPFTANVQDLAKSYDPVKEIDTADLRPLLDAAGTTGWIVLDFQAIRPQLLANKFGILDSGLAQLLWGYDAMVLIPEGRAAEFINEIQ
jgi:hypothetical protein